MERYHTHDVPTILPPSCQSNSTPSLTNTVEGGICSSLLVFRRNVLLGINDKNDVSLDGKQRPNSVRWGIRFPPHCHHYHDVSFSYHLSPPPTNVIIIHYTPLPYQSHIIIALVRVKLPHSINNNVTATAVLFSTRDNHVCWDKTIVVEGGSAMWDCHLPLDM